MCVCVCVYIYIYIYQHWYISICIYIYAYIHIYFCLLELLPLLFSYPRNVFEKKILLHLAVLSGKERTVYICICFSTWPGYVPFRRAFVPTNRSPWGTGLGDSWKEKMDQGASESSEIHSCQLTHSQTLFFVLLFFLIKELSWHDRRTRMKRYERKWIN